MRGQLARPLGSAAVAVIPPLALLACSSRQLQQCMTCGRRLGVDSAAGVTRTLLDPDFRPPQLLDDLSNLADGAYEVHALAEASMDACEWAVYRVRRCYSARAKAWRAVEVTHRADRAGAERFVLDLADSLGIAVRTDGEHARLWLTFETERYPRAANFGYSGSGNSGGPLLGVCRLPPVVDHHVASHKTTDSR